MASLQPSCTLIGKGQIILYITCDHYQICQVDGPVSICKEKNAYRWVQTASKVISCKEIVLQSKLEVSPSPGKQTMCLRIQPQHYVLQYVHHLISNLCTASPL